MESLLVSRCLFGEKVRYDGGDCLLRADFIARLKNRFNLIFICPEVMAGMSVPRNPIEILNGKIIDTEGLDLTDHFEPVIREIHSLVKKHCISKALLKDFSPSCGSSEIYDGSFTGTKVPGGGIITQFLKDAGVNVYSESEIMNLLKKD